MLTHQIPLATQGDSLTCYRFGTAKPVLLVLNAPGMSIKFWLPLISHLQSQWTVLAFEYRGFPSDRVWNRQELSMDVLVRDVLKLIDHHGMEAVNVASWCLGVKLGLELNSARPGLVRSLVALNPSHTTSTDLGTRSEFGKFVASISSRIDNDPQSIGLALRLMKSIGAVPTMDFFTLLDEEEDKSAALDLADLLQKESDYANLAFYLIDTPNGLRNYISLYAEFCQTPSDALFERLDVPLTIICGRKDGICLLARDCLDVYGMKGRYSFIEVTGSHFALIEQPREIAALIGRHSQPALTGESVAVGCTP
jgi:pimeloyl-ACP methyl ester carboxylesterase